MRIYFCSSQITQQLLDTKHLCEICFVCLSIYFCPRRLFQCKVYFTGANIFLTSTGHVKLGDFGCSVKLRSHSTMPGEFNNLVGTTGVLHHYHCIIISYKFGVDRV